MLTAAVHGRPVPRGLEHRRRVDTHHVARARGKRSTPGNPAGAPRKPQTHAAKTSADRMTADEEGAILRQEPSGVKNDFLLEYVVTSTIDTTCTMWGINTSHDREVYDGQMELCGSSTFDLRSLEHSTILYETSTVRANEFTKATSPHTPPVSTPLLGFAFNPSDSHYIAARSTRTLLKF
ncbi:hypothetical protein JB92DRAFT_3149239 [Gautieria morchelliformis]|nr:hypothetical protein JB92DRAFT_3149239 [Gautieria morchelliformis]